MSWEGDETQMVTGVLGGQDLSVCICVWRGSVRGKLDNVHKQVVFKVLVVYFFLRLHPRPQT